MTEEKMIGPEHFQDIFDRDVVIHHLKGLLETAVDVAVTNGRNGLSQAWLDQAKQAVGWEDE